MYDPLNPFSNYMLMHTDGGRKPEDPFKGCLLSILIFIVLLVISFIIQKLFKI